MRKFSVPKAPRQGGGAKSGSTRAPEKTKLFAKISNFHLCLSDPNADFTDPFLSRCLDEIDTLSRLQIEEVALMIVDLDILSVIAR